LDATISVLTDLPSRTDDENFMLAVAHFLRGIETCFQERYRTGLNDTELAMPGLSLPLPANPDPDPMPPETIADIFETLSFHMVLARNALDDIKGDVSVSLDLNDLWFDVNNDRMRNGDEDLFTLGLLSMVGTISPRQLSELEQLPEIPPVVFDTADVAWLHAYTHLLSGTANMVLAFDPTKAIQSVGEGSNQMAVLNKGKPPILWAGVDDQTITLIAIVLAALEQQPDPARTRAAHMHFTKMIEQNAIFWDAVATETDNNAEWVPNPNQTSALPISVPDGTGDAWKNVLSEASDILSGDLLIPHIRVNAGAGLNLQKWMEKPEPVDFAGYFHGYSLAPFMEQGDVATGQSLRDFERLIGPRTGMFMLFLN
jgi:hypothetical protein